MPFISSNPNAWMRPYYEAVSTQAGYAHLAIPLQFAALLEAIAVDHPAKAVRLREIDDLPSQRALLGSLANIVYSGPAQRETELWRVRKGDREPRCVAVYLPNGIDLRLLEGEDFRRTQLLKDGPALQERAEDWRQKLLERGWRVSGRD